VDEVGAKRLTATELLREDGAKLERLIGELTALSRVDHMDFRGTGIAYFGATGNWNDLDDSGRQLQTYALEEYRHLLAALRVLLRSQPAEALGEFEKSADAVMEFLERERTYSKTADDARTAAIEALHSQLDRLSHLYDRGDGRDVYVPDTNALLYNPALEEWRFDESRTFELVLAPSVVVELDELKINDRNEDVRNKAEGLIRRIKGYRQRGELTAGVALVSGTSTIKAFPVEPRLDESLPWLDPANRDDRFIATALEIVRQHPRSAVTIVTRDLNLQNKAEYARLPFIEPPGEPQPPRRRRPKVALREFRFNGGEAGRLRFYATVQNIDDRIIVGELAARIGSEEMVVEPRQVNLLVNVKPIAVLIFVPRPRLGDLVPALNNEPTLYGDTLELEMRVDGGVAASDEWSELVYDDANQQRAEIQQQIWRDRSS
jgi:hypothetical protein